MSYNGVGLNTVRGTGTSGYVTKNLASLGDTRQIGRSKKKQASKVDLNQKQTDLLKKDLQSDITRHSKLKDVERKCALLRDELEDQDISDAEIDTKVEELRKKLTAEIDQGDPNDDLVSGDKAIKHEEDSKTRRGTNSTMQNKFGTSKQSYSRPLHYKPLHRT